eukprot:3313368-Amphidinium_carterae.1
MSFLQQLGSTTTRRRNKGVTELMLDERDLTLLRPESYPVKAQFPKNTSITQSHRWHRVHGPLSQFPP